jgi:hypothetical protein
VEEKISRITLYLGRRGIIAVAATRRADHLGNVGV